MKKNLLLLLLFIGTISVFISCSKNDDDNVSIEGTWNVKKVTTYYYVHEMEEEGSPVTKEFANGDAVVTLSNGKYISNIDNGGIKGSGTYTLKGNKLTVKEDGSDVLQEYTVKTSTNNSLSITGGFSTVSENVKLRYNFDIELVK